MPLPPEDDPPVLAGGVDEVALVVVFAVVVGLLPPSSIVSENRAVMSETTYRYRARIASNTRPGTGTCIRRHMSSRRSSLVRRIAHMLGFGLRRRSPRWRG